SGGVHRRQPRRAAGTERFADRTAVAGSIGRPAASDRRPLARPNTQRRATGSAAADQRRPGRGGQWRGEPEPLEPVAAADHAAADAGAARGRSLAGGDDERLRNAAAGVGHAAVWRRPNRVSGDRPELALAVPGCGPLPCTVLESVARGEHAASV